MELASPRVDRKCTHTNYGARTILALTNTNQIMPSFGNDAQTGKGRGHGAAHQQKGRNRTRLGTHTCYRSATHRIPRTHGTTSIYGLT